MLTTRSLITPVYSRGAVFRHLKDCPVGSVYSRRNSDDGQLRDCHLASCSLAEPVDVPEDAIRATSMRVSLHSLSGNPELALAPLTSPHLLRALRPSNTGTCASLNHSHPFNQRPNYTSSLLFVDQARLTVKTRQRPQAH